MAIWVNEQEQKPFNGILLVMNPTGMGDLSVEEREIVSEAVKQAICDGWAVVRIYDKGADPAPDWMDDDEEYCFGRTPSWIHCKKVGPLTPSEKAELIEMMPITNHGNVSYVGLYEADGKVVFAKPKIGRASCRERV